jgi:hypothetical protein
MYMLVGRERYFLFAVAFLSAFGSTPSSYPILASGIEWLGI